MAKYWKEELPKIQWINDLTPNNIFYVEVCGFTFNFYSIEQVFCLEKMDYYRCKDMYDANLPALSTDNNLNFIYDRISFN